MRCPFFSSIFVHPMPSDTQLVHLLQSSPPTPRTEASLATRSSLTLGAEAVAITNWIAEVGVRPVLGFEVDIYKSIYIYIDTYTRTHIFIYIYTYKSTYIHIYIYTRVYIYICINTCTYVYIFIHVHTYIYIYTCTNMYIYIYVENSRKYMVYDPQVGL